MLGLSDIGPFSVPHVGKWGELRECAGWTPSKEKVRKAYEAFFETWKNADEDIPVLRQGRAEYAELGK